MQKHKNIRGYLTLSLLLMAFALLLSFFNIRSLAEIAQEASEAIERKATLCASASERQNNKDPREFEDLFLKEKIGVYTFRNDSLLSWNNSAIPLKEGAHDFPKKHGVIALKHGYYLYYKNVSGNTATLALSLIKPAYEIQNKYLSNNFSDWTGIPEEVNIRLQEEPYPPVKLGGEILFTLQGNETKYFGSGRDQLCFVLFLTGFFLLLLSLLMLAMNIEDGSFPLFAIVSVLTLRALMLYFKWPTFFYRTELYDVKVFGNADSFLNGFLGDLILNAIVMVYVALSLHFYFQRQIQIRKVKIFELGLIVLLLFLTVHAFNQTLVSLVLNSTLSFDFLNVFNLRFPAFIGLSALCVYALALFVLCFQLFGFFKQTSLQHFLWFFGIQMLVGVAVFITFPDHTHFLESFWLLIFSAPLYLLASTQRVSISLVLGLQMLLMTGITSKLLTNYIGESQRQELNILASKLGERQDPVLESEFTVLPQKISADENLHNLIQILPASTEGVEALIKQKFFTGYFDRYNLDFSLFDKDCHPMLPVKQAQLYNEGYFEDEIRLRSDTTNVEGLFFVQKYLKNTRYLAKIKLQEKSLYVMLEAKQFEELGSLPDLLLDRSQQKNEKLQNFSHAVYRSQQLTSHYGDLNYPYFLQDSTTFSLSHPEYLNHYFVADDGATVIISEPSKTYSYFFTFNSYLLLFFSLLTYSSYLVFAFLFTAEFKTPSLQRRIQLVIVGLLLIAMSAIGFTSGNLVTGQFERDNSKLLEEKTLVIINELSTQFLPRQFFDESRKELVNLKLREYARLFNTPISLFDKNGHLYNTSETKLYDYGLAAVLAHPGAFYNLKNNHSSAESVIEKAGTLTYLSFYTPLYDNKKELLGFVNLPYFAKQSVLAKELSGIISALINVYVILFVISILAGLILSGYITQPLRLIQQQIANITLGKENEQISWKSNDEIGKLVAEYNHMLVKLEHSAELLAKSERESAWREMAKQVAHEIKNPLTPMKLNLQYLLHVMKNEPGDFREKFEKTSKGIIEQIDSLANIATEFSNFAKLPATRLSVIDLSEVIGASLLIFENQKNIIILNHMPSSPIMVKGDRDQCLRVFNNVIKNAVQAMENVADPKIEIYGAQTGETVTISVKDNGCGINNDMKEKLFIPNFTTKSTGSGLGLAIVHNIMQGFEGKIWFESEINKGTTFYLDFKRQDGP